MRSGLGALIGLKVICCGGPLLAMGVLSGAVAVVDVAAGALIVAALLAALLVLRRGKSCTRQVTDADGASAAPVAVHRVTGSTSTMAADASR
jgi:hypothetical protein